MDNTRLNYLLDELMKGNMDCFDEFYSLTKRGVFSMAFQILHSQDEAENVMQDTYLKFLEKLPTMKKDKSVLAYLMTTARNLSLNVVKSYKKRVNDFDMESIQEEEKSKDDSAFVAMRKVLKDEECQIVLMHCLYDMSHKEIAKELHKPLGTITWSYNNAIKKLKEELEKNGYRG